MYSYEWDVETGGLLITNSPLSFSKEPRPVYYKELDILGFDKYWNYEKDDSRPYMWAESSNYFYRGRKVAKTKGGSLYTAPEIEILEDPEPNGGMLKFVDINLMNEKNRTIMEGLVQETIKKVYNTYVQYKNKVDVFYVAFSGGKDSVVALDIVSRALPHNEFKVLFGNTDMEFPTTLRLANEIKTKCENESITFIEAKSNYSAINSWKLFGPPARRLRWCCSVHKTVPVINKLCELYSLDRIRSMMITGVRGDESPSRSNYDEIGLGKKLVGQYSFHPILEWSSAEVYMYIYLNNLSLNEAYKYGFNRVGCIMCPNSSEKHEFMKKKCFPDIVDTFCELITENSSKDLSGNNKKEFMETGGWKTRFSGRELKFSEDERYCYKENKNHYIFEVRKLKDDWRTWYKTIGELVEESDDYFSLEYKGIYRRCRLEKGKDISRFYIENTGKNKNSIEFLTLFKSILIKTQYCIQCMTCVAECPNRNIEMKDGKVYISDNCNKCHSCLKIQNGCLYYNSIMGSKDVKNLKGITRYLSVGIEMKWIFNYFDDPYFEPGNRKTDVMFVFLKDAGILDKKKIFTKFGNTIKTIGLDNTTSWALMLCNLAYTPAFKWYIKTIPFAEDYIKERLEYDMNHTGTKSDKKIENDFWNGFKTIFDTNEYFQEIGIGVPRLDNNETSTGEIKSKMNCINRYTWFDPNPVVILFSLYKFAEACNDFYQFTLTRLMNKDIDSDGVSPVEIFGLQRTDMEKILKGLSVNYPEFINASFNLDLDNINLSSDKTSEDVLDLF